MVPWSSGQDVALSRRNQGFDSPWDYQKTIKAVWLSFFTPREIMALPLPILSIGEPLNSGKVVGTPSLRATRQLTLSLNAIPLGTTKKILIKFILVSIFLQFTYYRYLKLSIICLFLQTFQYFRYSFHITFAIVI